MQTQAPALTAEQQAILDKSYMATLQRIIRGKAEAAGTHAFILANEVLRIYPDLRDELDRAYGESLVEAPHA